MASKGTKPVLDIDKLTSTQLMETFKKWDKDGNYYIEDEELDDFIKDLFYKRYKSRNFSPDMIELFKEDIMKKYDRNHDKKIDITELACILPVEENFLMQFADKLKAKQELTSVEFMKIWLHYDPDREEVLGRKELMGFVADYIQFYGHSTKTDEADREVDWLLQKFDKDKDGEISMLELQGFLKVEDNFLNSFKIMEGKKVKGMNKLWKHYDRDKNGSIGGPELDALVRDLVAFKLTEKGKSDRVVTMKDISDWRDIMLQFSDSDGDEELMGEKELSDFIKKGLSRASNELLK